MTFLGAAVYKGLLTVAEYLLQCGADPNELIELGSGGFPRTLMSTAAKLNDVDMLQLLRKYGGRVQGNEAMHAAAEQGSMQAIDWLVNEGAQIGEVVRTIEGWEVLEEGEAACGPIYDSGTPLHSAASGGSMVAARYLLERGVRKDITDWQGKTAVDYAERLEKREVAALIKG